MYAYEPWQLDILSNNQVYIPQFYCSVPLLLTFIKLTIENLYDWLGLVLDTEK